MLNRTKAQHDLDWAYNRQPGEQIPWHHEEQQPAARRGRLTTLEALQLIRRRYEASLRETSMSEHSFNDHAQHEQQAA